MKNRRLINLTLIALAFVTIMVTKTALTKAQTPPGTQPTNKVIAYVSGWFTDGTESKRKFDLKEEDKPTLLKWGIISAASTGETTQPPPIVTPPVVTPPPTTSKVDPPPLDAIIVPIGATPPKVINNQKVAFERGGKATQSIEFKGDNVQIVAYGVKTLPLYELKSPSGAAAALWTNSKGKSVSIDGLSISPSNTNAHDRGEGIAIRGKYANIYLGNIWVTKFEKNITIEGPHGNVDINEARSTYAWGAQDQPYEGQGLYTDQVIGPKYTIRNSLFWHNGRVDDQLDTATNQYRHGNYNQHGNCRVEYVNCLIADNVSSGVQPRNGAGIDKSFFANNGVSMLAIGGTLDVSNSAISGATFYWSGTDWIGVVAVMAYCPINLKNVNILGTQPPSPAAMPAYTVVKNGKKTTSGVYQSGAIVISKSYPAHKEWSPKGGSLTCENVKLVGWQGPTTAGDAWSTDKATKKVIMPKGLQVITMKQPPVVQYRDLVDRHLGGDSSVVSIAIERAAYAAASTN